MDPLDRLVAKPALGHVDDPLERQIVGRLGDQPEVSQRIADLGALVKAKSPDDLVGQPDRDESFFKLARLELRPHQDRAVVQ